MRGVVGFFFVFLIVRGPSISHRSTILGQGYEGSRGGMGMDAKWYRPQTMSA